MFGAVDDGQCLLSDFLVEDARGLVDVDTAAHMVYPMIVEHTQGMGHSLVAIVAEMVVGQGDTVDLGIVQEVDYLLVTAQVGTNLVNLPAFARNNRVFQVQQAVVELVGYCLQPGKQSVAVTCVQ